MKRPIKRISTRQAKCLTEYLRQNAKMADKSWMGWSERGAKEQAAYHSGMWYAYHDVENYLNRLAQDD